MVEAGHPVPDQAGLEAAAKALALAESATRGRSRAGADVGRRVGQLDRARAASRFAEKQAVTRALLRSGAHIGEINTVRKHLSRIKGGRLARAAHPARVVTLAISDVPGDDPAVIGSGPTVPDPTTLADARAIVARFKLDLPRGGGARAERSRERKPEARRSGFRQQRIPSGRAPGRCVPRRGSRGARRRLRMRLPRRAARRRGARGRAPRTPQSRANSRPPAAAP